MKFFKIFILFSFFISANSFAQKVIKHTVKSGESIYVIAKKYDVTEKEIFDLNPKLKGSILSLKTEVKVPNKKFKEKEKVSKKDKKEVVAVSKVEKNTEIIKNEAFETHVVKPKETLYSISKKYGVAMETICEMNPELKTGNLKTGAKLKITNTNQEAASEKKEEISTTTPEQDNQVIKEELVANVDIVHKVLPKETLYGISKQTGVSVAELQQLNPSIANGLPVGYLMIVKKGSGKTLETKNDSAEKTFEDVTVKSIPAGNSAKAEFLISKASQHLGTRYRSGGTTEAGFDCSGLMFNTFKNIDMTLPRSSHEMANYGTKIDKSQAQKGDLIFFATFGGKRVSHVGMITEVTTDGEIKFIHSATSSGVIVSSINEDYYTRTFVQINRVISE